MRVARRLRNLVAFGVVTMVSGTALAQSYYLGEQTSALNASSMKLTEMSQRIEALEASLLGDAKGDGWTDVSGEKWTHKWGGLAQADYVLWARTPYPETNGVTPLAENYVEFRRLRLFCTGTGYGIYDYKFQLNFEADGNVGGDAFGAAENDMYVGIHEVPLLGYVRMGHFFVPFSIEQETSNKYITFLERAAPGVIAFSPGREVGICAYNNTPGNRLHWAYGAFFDSISQSTKEYTSDAQGIRVAGRGWWVPYYDEPTQGRYSVHLGGAMFWTDDKNDSVRWSSRPNIHEGRTVIDTGVIVADEYTTANIETAVVWGPFSVQAEGFGARTIGAAQDVNFYGGYAQASWFLTGEHRAYDRDNGRFIRVSPYSNFWAIKGAGCGSGAWEAKIRWSFLDLTDYTPVGSALDRGAYNDITMGLNWYLNPYVCMKFDWIHAWTTAGTVNANTVGTADSDIIAMRLQYDF